MIELLVVIAIIAILIGLLLPAVQKVRDAASRLQCTNNLKQIGLALQTHHDANRQFPAGYTSGVGATGDDTGPGWGWAAYILPQMEQQNLFNQINFDQPIQAATNSTARTTIVKAYMCPAENPPPTITTAAVVCDVASANYIGMFGVGEPGVDGDGIFYRNSVTKIGDIRDGTSNTIAAGERSYRVGQSTWVGAVAGANHLAPAGAIVPDQTENASNFVLGHTAEAVDGPTRPKEQNHFASRHAGGVVFVFADGHVASLSSSVNYTVFKALSTRAGGETIPGGY